jgi:Lrp/AsnC family leucine-responsive transcriptional regulator
MEGQRSIDRIDKIILRTLQKNYRISNHLLAYSLHISDAKCAKRVRNLEQSGYILGYVVRLNPQKLDASVLVIIEVTLNASTSNALLFFEQQMQLTEEVLECHLVTGTFHYLVKSRIRDLDSYADFVYKFQSKFSNIKEIRSYVIQEEVKNTTDLHIA